jgi:predicted nucleotidyltransferase
MAIGEFLTERTRDLPALCARHHVQSLELFGSAANGDFTADSDVDFLVQFQPMSPGDHARAYLELLESLQELFGRPVDLIEVNAIENPYFLKRVNESRKLVYAA